MNKLASSVSWKPVTFQNNKSSSFFSKDLCFVRRLWTSSSSSSSEQEEPKVPLVHNALVFKRDIESKKISSSNLATTSASSSSSSSSISCLRDIDAKGWCSLFSASIDPAVSNPKCCATFVISDWHVFAESAGEENEIPFPVFNVVHRQKDDFEYNNDCYENMRKTVKKSEFLPVLLSQTESDEGAQPRSEKQQQEEVKKHETCQLLPQRQHDEEEGEEEMKVRKATELNLKFPKEENFFFYPFPNSTKNIVFASEFHFVITNLKPVEALGHLLIVPKKVAGTLYDSVRVNCSNNNSNNQDLEEGTEQAVFTSLGSCISASIQILEANAKINHKGKKIDGFSVVVQQGAEGGQTVPHQHTHVIALIKGAGLAKANVVDPDAVKKSGAEKEAEEVEMRKPRTRETMAEEAEQLREVLKSLSSKY